MALVKDRGHPSGLHEKGIYYDGSIEGHRFCFIASAECDHPLVGVGRELVPRRLRQTRPVLCSLLRAVFTFNAGQTTKWGPLGDLGYIPFDSFKRASHCNGI